MFNQIEFKGGLEIHRQLDTNKLFCSCPSFLRKDEPDFIVLRKLHKVPGETGSVDVAVEYEHSLNKDFIYQGYYNTNCLVELDEEPPHFINEEALDEAIKIALLMNCEIYSCSQIMRKIVIDGSNTTGFQRTVLIGYDGFVETSFGKVPIETVALEEDAARIIEKDDRKVVYRLDRLGIPLIEISTAPVMKTAEQIKETALKIGEMLSVCKVKRGIGSIRQDVNLSVKGHEKVEIKGFQEPSMMEKTIHIEIERQQKELLDGKTSGEVRNALNDGTTEFLRPLPGKERLYPETDLPLLKISREKINKIKKSLPKLKSEIKNELKKKGVSENLIELIVGENLEEFEVLLNVYGKNANLVAKMVTLWRTEIATKLKISDEKIREILSERVLEEILMAVNDKKIEEEEVKKVMEKIALGVPLDKVVTFEKISDDEITEEILKIIKEKPGLSANAYMGLLMQKFRDKIPAKRAMEILKKYIS